jgi:hypothetical protein
MRFKNSAFGEKLTRTISLIDVLSSEVAAIIKWDNDGNIMLKDSQDEPNDARAVFEEIFDIWIG